MLLEPGQEDLVAFLAEHHVRVVASMPCYSAGAGAGAGADGMAWMTAAPLFPLSLAETPSPHPTAPPLLQRT